MDAEVTTPTCPPPDSILATWVPLMSSWQCKKRYGNSYSSHGTLCAGSPPDTSLLHDDGCQGNSGGGLLCQEASGRWVLAGVVAGGNGCGDPSSPSLYTRVSRFRAWLDEAMAPGPRSHRDTHLEHTQGEGGGHHLHTQDERAHTHERQENNEIADIRNTPGLHPPLHVHTHTQHTHSHRDRDADTNTPTLV